MKQYILLDWDGNLAKTLDIWLEAIRMALQKRAIHKTDEEIAMCLGQFVHYMQQWGVPDVQQTIIDADAMVKQKLPEVDLYPDAVVVLEELKKRGKKLALITTSPRINLQQVLEKHSLTDTFDAIITGDDATQHKPHPEPLELALKRLGGTKDQAIMIGDSDKDLGAAKNASIDSILFYPAEHRKFYKLEKLKEFDPTYVIEDFRKVIELVQFPVVV